MADNFLKYTGLDYAEISAQIRDKINSDPRFDNFRESAIAQTLLEIFSGTVDINNYYIQRRAEECYFDTAQLKSSVISLSRQLGYVVSRAEPAQMNMKIVLEGNYVGVFDSTEGADNKIQIPYYSKFTIDGNDFALINTWTFNITQDILDQINTDGDDFKLEIVKDSFDNDITLAQGEIKEKVIIGNNNSQVGSNFQVYKIEDKEFSNIFGDKDYFHNPVTKIFVGNEKTDDTKYSIDRRSLINWESLESTDLSDATKVCVVRTSPDEYVELLFGDGGFAAKGPLTREDNIYIQYLATKGDTANKVGIIGDTINYGGEIYTNRGVDITDKIKFEAHTNITGGVAIESLESIKYSSPKVYYSLDRLVSKDDYIAYLKGLKSPIVVQNAIAWGEQEERDKNGVFADIKMFNVGFFSVVGSLYNTDGKMYNIKTSLDDAVLDLNYDPNEIQVQSYFNVYTRQAQANQLKQYDVVSYYSKFNGSEIDTSVKTPSYYGSKYGDNAVLRFTYTSNITDNASNITADGSITVDLSSISTTSSMEDIANLFNNELAKFKDARANSYDNLNYQSEAFTSATGTNLVAWNGTENRFEVSFDTNTPAYIESFVGDVAIEFGLNDSTLFSVAITQKEEISGRIIQVVDDLNSRGQMNINNIYISPIIHNFNITGSIYIKPLYDKEQLKTEINNSIYKWLDINADFNEPIRLSNIVEIIEKNPGVVNANLSLVPEDITQGYNNETNKYYLGIDDSLLKPYGFDAGQIFGRELISYLGYDDEYEQAIIDVLGQDITSGSGNDKESYDPIDRDRKFYNTMPAFKFMDGYLSIDIAKTIENEYYYLNNYVNERTFFNDFVGGLYSKLLKLADDQTTPLNPDDVNNHTYVDVNGETVTNYRRMISWSEPSTSYRSSNRYTSVDDNSDFVKLVGKIHKDLSYIIKLNMIDSHGNIEEEYDTNGRYVRGGYSLGSEVAQVSLNSLLYEYK